MFEDLTKEDLTFLGYVELHCKTERALFSGNDVLRLYELADVVPQEKIELNNFYRMDDMYALPLVELAKMRAPKPPRLKPEVLGWSLFQGITDPQTRTVVEWKMFATFPERAMAEVQSTKLSGRTRIIPCDIASLKIHGLRRMRQGTYVNDPEFDFDLSDNND